MFEHVYSNDNPTPCSLDHIVWKRFILHLVRLQFVCWSFEVTSHDAPFPVRNVTVIKGSTRMETSQRAAPRTPEGRRSGDTYPLWFVRRDLTRTETNVRLFFAPPALSFIFSLRHNVRWHFFSTFSSSQMGELSWPRACVPQQLGNKTWIYILITKNRKWFQVGAGGLDVGGLCWWCHRLIEAPGGEKPSWSRRGSEGRGHILWSVGLFCPEGGLLAVMHSWYQSDYVIMQP